MSHGCLTVVCVCRLPSLHVSEARSEQLIFGPGQIHRLVYLARCRKAIC